MESWSLCVIFLFPTDCLTWSLLLPGITTFDLLGDFGRFNWLGNFYIVLSYNLLFAVVTTLCLVRKFTSAVREELLKALGTVIWSSLFQHVPQHSTKMENLSSKHFHPKTKYSQSNILCDTLTAPVYSSALKFTAQPDRMRFSFSS